MKPKPTVVAKNKMMIRIVPIANNRCIKAISAIALVIMSPIVYLLKKSEPCCWRVVYSFCLRSKATPKPDCLTLYRA